MSDSTAMFLKSLTMSVKNLGAEHSPSSVHAILMSVFQENLDSLGHAKKKIVFNSFFTKYVFLHLCHFG